LDKAELSFTPDINKSSLFDPTDNTDANLKAWKAGSDNSILMQTFIGADPITVFEEDGNNGYNKPTKIQSVRTQSSFVLDNHFMRSTAGDQGSVKKVMTLLSYQIGNAVETELFKLFNTSKTALCSQSAGQERALMPVEAKDRVQERQRHSGHGRLGRSKCHRHLPGFQRQDSR
jgi:predicted ATPase